MCLDARSAVRLLSGGPIAAKGPLRAGVEIRLASGWKTYCRYPGDSGVPPAFDFSGSENVKSVSILWPAPQRFTDDDGTSIGYKGELIFPVHVVPENPNRSTTLRLALDYAVCEKLCIPAKGRAMLELARTSSAHVTRLMAAEARTPKQVRVGDLSPFGIAAVHREPGNPHPRVVVDVTAAEAAPLDLFAEGPGADWALPVPEPVTGAPPGQHRFTFELDGAPPGVDTSGARLRFTLVAGDRAVEVTAVPEPH